MTKNSKVIWTEGMFLRPQHFQQQERHLLNWVESRCSGLTPYGWGLSELIIDDELLALGKIAINKSSGVFADGTPFNIPDEHLPPLPIEIPNHIKNETLYLSLPLYRMEGKEVSNKQNEDALSRYNLSISTVNDRQTNIDNSEAEIEIGLLVTQLRIRSQDKGAFTNIPIGRILEVKQNGEVILDRHYISTCFSCIASPILFAFIKEIHGLLMHQSTQLAQRLALPSARGTAEIVDFLYLQIINRYTPLLNHLHDLEIIHPINFYQILLQIAGELATITKPDKHPDKFPPYLHKDLTATFQPVMNAVREALNWIPDHLAIAIPLKTHPSGVRTGIIPNREMITSSLFVLAVNANVPTEKIRSQFPQQTTIAPSENLKDWVNSHTPGIKIHALTMAPRQIPYNSGFSYFELDQHNKLWQELEKNKTIAMHFSGDYPDLQLELWAIKGS